MLSFHTPKPPPPLNLDVRSLSGGGSCPSQFEGKTHDGRDIYVRYRGAHLTIQIAKQPGQCAVQDGELVYEAGIGAPFNGTLSLTQFCTLAGVTVQGEIPPETDPDASSYDDLTGATTFFTYHLRQITPRTARDILVGIGTVWPDALCVCAVTDDRHQCLSLDHVDPADPKTSAVWAVLGETELANITTSPSRYVLPRAGQLQLVIRYTPWQWPGPKFSSLLTNQARTNLS